MDFGANMPENNLKIDCISQACSILFMFPKNGTFDGNNTQNFCLHIIKKVGQGKRGRKGCTPVITRKHKLKAYIFDSGILFGYRYVV